MTPPSPVDAISNRGVADISIPGAVPFRRGKVRAVFEAGEDRLVIVATDRLSAYDSVLPTPIPGKGEILTRLTTFWLSTLRSASPHHLVSEHARPAEDEDLHATPLATRATS